MLPSYVEVISKQLASPPLRIAATEEAAEASNASIRKFAAFTLNQTIDSWTTLGGSVPIQMFLVHIMRCLDKK